MVTQTNLELSQEFYKESFYKIIKSLMNEFGWFIHRDLAFLLRQITLSRIACIRSNTQYINKKYGVDLRFEEDLDPLEAIDMFIAYPQCPEFDNLTFVKITTGWEHKYGSKISSAIAELFLAVHRNERYLLKNMFEFFNNVLGENYDLAGAFYTSDQLISSMTKDSRHELFNEVAFEDELECLSSAKLHQKHLLENFNYFANNLSAGDREKFYEIVNSCNRISEKFFLECLNCMQTELSKQIKDKFGEEHDISLDVKFKYNNNFDSTQDKATGYYYASSYQNYAKLTTEIEKVRGTR